MAKNIYILGKVRDLLDYKAMHTLYFFLYLSYCVEIWGEYICKYHKTSIFITEESDTKDSYSR